MDGTPITHLPSEILMLILEHLPASFFQQDLGRLALSRRWYSLAFPVYYPRIELTPRVISRLVHRKSKALDKARAQLRKTLRCANIVVTGKSANTTDSDSLWRRVSPGGEQRGLGWGGGGRWGWEDAATACFNTSRNLCRLYLLLHECRELRTVRFTAGWQNLAWRADPLQPNYLCLHSLEPYLTLMTHVTALDLDLCGTDVVNAAGQTAHLCDHLRQLLSRLRTLRLRTRSICRVALWPLEDQPVTLRELTVNVYLGHVSENNPKLNSSRTCSLWEPRRWDSPMDELRAGMTALVKRMPEPRRVEMVHLAPSGEVHVWDALTDACSRDWSERPRQFPLCFEPESRRPCFREHADDGVWGEEVGLAGIFTTNDQGQVPDDGSADLMVPNHMAQVDGANMILMGMA